MKTIVLPNKELRLLSGQLQNFQAGFTVQQIRSLDRVIKVMEETLKPFTEGLNKILIIESSYKNEQEKIDNEAKKENALNLFINTEGEKKMTCSFIDEDFEFIKLVWSKMVSLRGTQEAREAIIKIDDALTGASEPVFDKAN